MSIFLSCGEASGDNYLALLVGALKEQGYHDGLWGMLGPQAIEAGGNKRWSYHELHLMGILEVLPSIPRLLKLRRNMVSEIMARSPEVVVVVDSPDFHIPLIRSLRKAGYSGFIAYIAPPTVWAWRESRTEYLQKYCDLCLPLLPFENDFLLSRGVHSAWIGHPLLDSLEHVIPSDQIPPSPGSVKTIALLPGSRPSEIRRHLPLLLDCAPRIREMGMDPVFSISPGLPDENRIWMKTQLDGNWSFSEGPATELIASSRAVVGVSGTVSVEAMLLGKFMIVIYRGSFLSWVIYKLFIKTSFISIPNIMAGREVFPEYLQKDVTVDNVLCSLEEYIHNRDLSAETDRTILQLRKSMGGKGAPAFWAARILEKKRL